MALTSGTFLILLAAGASMVFVLGVAGALTLALGTSTPLTVVAQRLYTGLDSFPIMAIPLFVLAGLLMESGGIARRIVELAAALVGWITGSLLIVATVTGAGLAGISGSGSADTAAISSILLPEMKRRNYDIDYASCAIAAAGALAPIIPASSPRPGCCSRTGSMRVAIRRAIATPCRSPWRGSDAPSSMRCRHC